MRELLRELGYADAEPLAIGMQGEVFRLGGGRIAKVWFHAGTAELTRLAEFYAGLDRLAVRTPEILEVHGNVTIEVELPGVPLHDAAPEFGTAGWAAARDGVLDVLGELASVKGLPELPVLDEREPFRGPEQSWPEALAGLVERRVDRFRGKLEPAIPDLARKVERLLSKIRSLSVATETLIHGDVTAGNILVDAQLRPTAVIDFGLLTMGGDPAYDAASAATMYALWSPRIREVEATFDAPVVGRFGYDPELLRIYRAAHLLIVANAHDDDPYERDDAVGLAAAYFTTR